MYKDLGKVIVRKPLFEWHSLISETGDFLPLADLLEQKLKDPVFLEGIYWASPALFKQVERLQAQQLTGEKRTRLLHTLQKYLIRASTRCTPYGTFAGCSWAEITGATPVPEQDRYRRVRIDADLLQQLVHTIATEEAYLPHFTYQINNTLYPSGQELRYIETLVNHGKLVYQISSIDRTEVLDELMEQYAERKIQYADIDTLVGTDTDTAEKQAFFAELVTSQILIPEIYSSLTATDPLAKINDILQPLAIKLPQKAVIYHACIQQLQQTRNKINSSPLGKTPLRDIASSTSHLETIGLSWGDKHIFQADLWSGKNQEDVFPKSLSKVAQAGIDALARLTPASSPQQKQLQQFKQLFKEKYGDLEIPLLQAVDLEQGIGFPAKAHLGNQAHNELIDTFPQRDTEKKFTSEMDATPVQTWLANKVREASEQGLQEIEISKNELANFDSQLPHLAEQINILGTRLADDHVLLHSVGGANGLPFIGRFAYLNKSLYHWSKAELLSNGSPTETIHAEVVHFPGGRAGNIARNTNLLPYQIPYLAYLENEEHSVLATDLLVSVQQDTIILRSKRRNKQILPYLAHAHNHSRSDIPLYRFLAALQHQGKTALHIPWGNWARQLRFIPRVRTGKAILHRATWNIYRNDIQQIQQASDALQALSQALRSWHVPRLVCLQEGDNELLIDTSKPDYLGLLLQEIKGKPFVQLVEWLAPATSEHTEKAFIQQFVLPLKKTISTQQNSITLKENAADTLQYQFVPGSEWVYYKLYCGAYIADELLLRVVKPCIEQLSQEQLIDQAFFIRYNDPHHHVRFRLHIKQPDKQHSFARITSLLHSLAQVYLADQRIWKLQLDTYQREVQRYSPDSMQVSEQAFYFDSMAILHLLEQERFREDATYRFALALQNIDNWLSLFAMPLDARIQYCSEMSAAFSREFDKATSRQIDQQYRLQQEALSGIVQEHREELQALFNRDKALEPLNLPSKNISSYIHMSMNRWFYSNQRLLEYMAYRYCEKQYKQVLSLSLC